MIAAGEGAGQGEQVRVLGLDVLSEVGCSSGAARRQQPGDRQGNRLAFSDGDLRGSLVGQPAVIGKDDVGVGSAEAEAGDAGDFLAGVFGPFARVLDDFQVFGVKVDVVVGAGVIDVGRDDAVAHTFDNLDEANHARSGFRVADVGLGGTQEGWGRSLTARAEHAAEGGGLDGITEDGASAVGLNVVHVLGADTGVGVGALEDVDLRVRVRSGQAVGVAVGVDGGALDDGSDGVAVAFGVLEALENKDTGGVRADDAVGVIGERMDGTGGRGDAELAKADGSMRRGQDVHAAG